MAEFYNMSIFDDWEDLEVQADVDFDCSQYSDDYDLEINEIKIHTIEMGNTTLPDSFLNVRIDHGGF